MRKRITITLLLASLALFTPIFSTAQCLLSGPQKVVIDRNHKRLLISNAYSGGDIIQIDSLGVQDCFVENADFIDGIEVVGDTVFGVGDNRRVYAYNLSDTQLVMDVSIPGSASNYLSSVLYDSAGHLFISCPKLNLIYKFRISDQAYWVFASGTDFKKPNGMLLEREKNRIVVIGDATTNAKIYAVSLADSTVSELMATTFSSPDGIVRDKFGTYYVAGYDLPGIFRIDSAFFSAPVMCYAGTRMIYPTYDISDHSLLVTHYNTNTWERIPLAGLGIANEKPEGFFLYPVSPNPFSSSVSLKYELKYRSSVLIEIYNMYGILAGTLLNAEMDAGTHTFGWDAKSISGNSLPDGIYYFRFTINGYSQSQKAILINSPRG